jgi:hypothetical protein
MLFCIAALGSTWGAYAAWFERLVGGSDRAEMMGAGSLYNHAEALYDANTARINALTLLRWPQNFARSLRILRFRPCNTGKSACKRP